MLLELEIGRRAPVTSLTRAVRTLLSHSARSARRSELVSVTTGWMRMGAVLRGRRAERQRHRCPTVGTRPARATLSADYAARRTAIICQVSRPHVQRGQSASCSFDRLLSRGRKFPSLPVASSTEMLASRAARRPAPPRNVILSAAVSGSRSAIRCRRRCDCSRGGIGFRRKRAGRNCRNPSSVHVAHSCRRSIRPCWLTSHFGSDGYSGGARRLPEGIPGWRVRESLSPIFNQPEEVHSRAPEALLRHSDGCRRSSFTLP